MDENGLYGGYTPAQEYLREFEDLRKSFNLGAEVNPANATGGGANRLQSIEETFKSITFKEQSAAFWREVPKDTATSTVLEYSRINEVGQLMTYLEGGDVPDQTDFYDRKYDVVKFMGIKGSVSFVAKMTQAELEGAELLETQQKTRSFVRGMDLLCYYGDSSIIPTEFDGLVKKIKTDVKNPSQNIIDLRGKRFNDSTLNLANEVIEDNYGNTSGRMLWLAPHGYTSWVEDKIATKSFITNLNMGLQNDISLGDSFKRDSGEGFIRRDIFLRPQTALLNGIVNSTFSAFQKTITDAPDAPTVVLSSEATNGSYSLDNGDYDYAIVPINSYGRGMAYEGTVTHSGGGKMTKFVITHASTGNPVQGFEIYRRAGASSNIRDYYLVSKYAAGTGGTTTIYDNGDNIPGTSIGFLIDWDKDQVIKFKQYSPMMKLYYGIRSDKLEWLQKLYGVLQIYNANKIVMFKNIGKTAWS